MPTLPEALAVAVQHHQAGELSRAEAVYRRILEADPNHSDAWHLLGVIAHQVGRHDLALEFIGRAIRIQPAVSVYYSNLGEAYRAAGQPAEAAARYQEALRLQPDFAEAYNNLGNALQELGQPTEAEVCYRESLRLRPDYVEAHNNLGNALRSQSKLAEAEVSYREALRLRPDYAEAHNNLANILNDLGKPAGAEYETALELKPDFFEARIGLGNFQREQGRLEEAAAQYQRALGVRPQAAEAHNNLGNVFQELGRTRDAVFHLQEAVRFRPDYAEAHNNLGNALRQEGNLQAALDSYREALRLKPEYAEAHNNLGNLFREQGKLTESEACYHEALHWKPEYAEAHNNLGNILQDQGKLAEAKACYREALRLKPDYPDARSNLLFGMIHAPDADADEVFKAHCLWGTEHGTAGAITLTYDNVPSPDRRLRIGYVSADYYEHAAARFLEPILAHHDPRQFEITCYANVPTPDATTARLQAMGHFWRSIRGLSDSQVVDRVRADRIDILVDLSGHTAGNRLGVFARKPAPIQITYLGYPGTTGLKTIDYRLTDWVLDPLGEPSRDLEELVRLPASICFQPPENAPPVVPLPARLLGRFTFGSLHRLSKLNPRVLDLWCQVLEAVPNARLLIYRHSLLGKTEEDLRRQFSERGIVAGRLDLRHEADARGYLGICDDIDLMLDVFPWTGHVISCEALWMGVPVLTLAGQHRAARLSAGVLASIGLSRLTAGTPEEYVALAVHWAGDLDKLAQLRSEMRERMNATLCDGKTFTADLEEAYWSMWRKWCLQART